MKMIIDRIRSNGLTLNLPLQQSGAIAFIEAVSMCVGEEALADFSGNPGKSQ